jgi:hypothetical protein
LRGIAQSRGKILWVGYTVEELQNKPESTGNR